MRRRASEEWVLTAAGALYGIAIAVAASPGWTLPAPTDQIPGLLRQKGLDARVPFLDVVAVIAFAIGAGLAARALARKLRDSPPQVAHSVAVALLLAAWSGISRPIAVASQLLPASLLRRAVSDDVDFRLVLATGIGGSALCWLLRHRIEPFRSADLILIPVALSTFFALGELAPSAPVQLLVVASIGSGLLLRFLTGSAATPWRFGIPAATLILHASPFETAASPYAALVAIVVWPLLATWALRASFLGRGRAAWAVAALIYPLIAFTYPHTHSLTRAEGMPRADIFEDGHFLLPASEIARGERPFRDIVPQHGLLSDGAIEALAIRLGADDLGAVLRTREFVSSLNGVALYLVILAATGSPHCAMAGLLASSAFLLTGTTFLRSAPSLFVLAAAAGSLRLRSRRLLAVGSALVPIALLTAPEFGAYALLVVALACWISGRGLRRGTALLSAASFAASTAVAATLLALWKIPWLTVTLRDVLTAGPAYGVGRLELPASLASRLAIPEIAAGLFAPGEFLHVAWFGILLTTIALALTSRSSRRSGPLVVIGAWTVLAAASYAQRHQMYFRITVIAFLAAAAFVLLRSRTRGGRSAGALVTLVIWTAIQPTMHVAILRFMRQTHGPLDQVREWSATSRSSGALFRTEDIPRLETVRRAVERLGPDETFFDYSNAPILYYLFDRPCPVRQTDVPFYELPRLQQEVVATLERDPSIRLAVLGFSYSTTIDGIPNAQRTPMVAACLRRSFSSVDAGHGVVLATRRGSNVGVSEVHPERVSAANE